LKQPDDKIQRRLEQLRSVRNEFNGTLSAEVALVRVGMVLDDAGRMEQLLGSEPTSQTEYPPFIISYYSVTLVTCLEWHARSRLCDLFVFKPDVVRDKDLEQGFSSHTVAHLIRDNASIPQYFAATRNYSTTNAYLGAIDRVYEGLGLRVSTGGILAGLSKQRGYDVRTNLDELYDYRHDLVHQINRGHIDHPILRNEWTCKDAVQCATFVKELIEALEAVIEAHAPSSFPNRSIHRSEGTDTLLLREIDQLEAELSATVEGFKEVSARSAQAREAEEEWFQYALPHFRWIDTKAAPRRALLKGRLAYLKALKEELG